MHLMYVDESGDSGLPPDRDVGPQRGPSERYVRVGVIVHGWRWRATDTKIKNFKMAHGLQWSDELHADDIRHGKKGFKGRRQEDRQALLNNLLDTIGRELLDVSLLGVVITKRLVDRSRKGRLSDPSPRSLELLLEAYNAFLRDQVDKCGIVILDARENKDDANLRYFQSYLREFSERVDARRIVEGSFFLPSHTSNMLQIADVCANVLNRRYRWTDEVTREFARIEDRFAGRIIEWPQGK